MADLADEVGGTAWTLAPDARRAMLLEASRTALAQRDYAQAVVLAEELLDEDPDDVEALVVVADAAPRYGHGEVGALAAVQAARRGVEIGALEAAALLCACQVPRALDLADAVIARRPTEARAHAVRAQALELLRRPEEAALAYACAAAFRPDLYPLPLAVTDDDWDTVLVAALAGLDSPLRDVLRRARIDLLDLPDLSTLRGLSPPPSPLVDALLVEADARRPRIEVYRTNLARGTHTVEDLEERLRDALALEAAALLDEDPR